MKFKQILANHHHVDPIVNVEFQTVKVCVHVSLIIKVHRLTVGQNVL